MSTALDNRVVGGPGEPAAKPAGTGLSRGSDGLVLRAVGLCKRFGGQIVLDGVSLGLRRGEVVLLRGDNGSGKTTLLNILTGNLEPEAGVIEVFANGAREEFRFPRRWWQWLNPLDHFAPERLARECVGRTWQDVRLFNTRSVVENVVLGSPRRLGENPFWALVRRRAANKEDADLRLAATERLAALGLEDIGAACAEDLSLAEAKLVAIARALTAGARVLFLDEPLAGLDDAGAQRVLEALQWLARKGQATLVVVEHVFNIPLVRRLATTEWALADGRLSVSSVGRDEETGDWLDRVFRAAGDGFRVRERRLARGACLVTLSPRANAGPGVLQVQDLVVHRGGRTVIGGGDERTGHRGLALTLRAGEIGVLAGPNGWGKSTLLGAIAGTVPITSGAIAVNSHRVEHLPTWRRRRLGLRLTDVGTPGFRSLTVAEVLQLANSTRTPVQVGHLRAKRVGDLSGGERRQLELACGLGDDSSSVNLLDEPFVGLDAAALRSLVHTLVSLGGTSLITMPLSVGRKGELWNS